MPWTVVIINLLAQTTLTVSTKRFPRPYHGSVEMESQMGQQGQIYLHRDLSSFHSSPGHKTDSSEFHAAKLSTQRKTVTKPSLRFSAAWI